MVGKGSGIFLAAMARKVIPRLRPLAAAVAALLTVASVPEANGVTETQLPVGKASIYLRTIGRGQSVIVLHGGPDFDTAYLLPEMDRLQDLFRLTYYDQRGRGRSGRNVRPEDVTLASELEDLDRVRRHTGSESVILLGHSWGAVLALEYALRNPSRVSALILMNPAPQLSCWPS